MFNVSKLLNPGQFVSASAKDSKQKRTKIQELLKKKYDLNQEKFMNDWVYFELIDIMVQEPTGQCIHKHVSEKYVSIPDDNE